MPRVRLAVDIGGTFTDLVLTGPGGVLFTSKLRSTPTEPERAVLDGIACLLVQAGLAGRDVVEVLHGTTIGSNTLLQKTGARCGVLTTRGFRDVLEIGRLRTPTMFDLLWDKPEPLVRRRHRLEVDERMLATGEVLRPLDEADVRAAGTALVSEGIEVVAVCFLHSHRNPAHEHRAASVLRETCPGLAVTVSSEVCPEAGEYERTSTTVVNAYVLPAMRGYLRRLSEGIKGLGIVGPLLVATSSGGLAGVSLAQARPVYFVSSGRSAGAVGAASLGVEIGERDLVVFDMGGTTASAALVQHGEVQRTREYEFRDGISTNSRFIKAGGTLMRVPAVDVAEVGSGGGSIASVDPGGALLVGPRSAGSEPGPACYGRGGTDPTVTDANLILGYLPQRLAAGSLSLDSAAAHRAITEVVAAPLRLTVERAAEGIRAVANATMARAIRAVTVERGLDPRDLTLLAFGGSGPVHACDLAVLLGMRRVLFPPGPGVFTASGMLASEPRRELVRSFPTLLHRLEPAAVNGLMETMAEAARSALESEMAGGDAVELLFTIDLRFRHQDIEIPVPLPRHVTASTADELRQDFLDRYRAVFRYASADAVESSSIRLIARVGREGGFRFADLSLDSVTTAPEGLREAVFGGVRIATPVRDRATLRGAATGPLILDAADSTIVIPPGALVQPDALGNILVTLGGDDTR